VVNYKNLREIQLNQIYIKFSAYLPRLPRTAQYMLNMAPENTKRFMGTNTRTTYRHQERSWSGGINVQQVFSGLPDKLVPVRFKAADCSWMVGQAIGEKSTWK
jgi:hypothetical protein